MTTIATKLFVPPPRPDRVARAHLLARLDDGLAPGRRLILVSSPAGSGKTTLLSDWVHHARSEGGANPVAFAWLSLDEGDNDPARFLLQVTQALGAAAPGVGKGAAALLETLAAAASPLEAALAALINDLASHASPLVLVLDDYHVIEQPAVHAQMAFLLEHLPPMAHVAVATRTDPPLPLARLRARDQITELRADELRFSLEEAATFLSGAMGLALSESDIAALESRTEGWIAGLQLAALSMRGRDDLAGFVAAFTGSNRYVLDYLVEEVLRRQPGEVQLFLLRTSILDRMTGALCDALTGRDDGSTMLETLEGANLFLLALDQERAWYRYHRLFAEFLRVRLFKAASRGGEEGSVAALHRRASAWFEDQHLIPEAIDHALRGEDVDRAARLVEAVAQDMLMPGEAGTLLGWLDALPAETVQSRARLGLARAWALLTSGHTDEVEPWLAQAGRVNGGEEESITGEVAALRAIRLLLSGDAMNAGALARQALAHLPPEALFLRSWMTLNLGMAYERLGDIEAATQEYIAALAISEKAGNGVAGFTAVCQLADIKVLQGRLHEGAALYDQALAVGSHALRHLPFLAMAYARIGELRYEWNDLEGASEILSTTIALGRQWEAADISVCAPADLALVRLAQGEREAAEALAMEAETAMRGPMVSPLTVDIARARLIQFWLAAGDREAALRFSPPDAATAPSGASRQKSGELTEIEGASLARLRLAEGDPEAAAREIETALQSAERLAHGGNVIALLVLQALAQDARGRQSSALTALGRALSLAEPQGYVRAFVDAGPALAPLLRKARGLAPAYVERLLDALGDAPGPAVAARSNAALVEPLSEREIEVLALVGRGLSNKEIADRLVVSLSTVKSHINNIYGKLGVQSRVQAVTRAQEFGLL